MKTPHKNLIQMLKAKKKMKSGVGLIASVRN